MIKLFSDICIHFALEKETEKIAIFKKHSETLRSILKAENSLFIFAVEEVIDRENLKSFMKLFS